LTRPRSCRHAGMGQGHDRRFRRAGRLEVVREKEVLDELVLSLAPFLFGRYVRSL
jgi:hypothetical protein